MGPASLLHEYVAHSIKPIHTQANPSGGWAPLFLRGRTLHDTQFEGGASGGGAIPAISQCLCASLVPSGSHQVHCLLEPRCTSKEHLSGISIIYETALPCTSIDTLMVHRITTCTVPLMTLPKPRRSTLLKYAGTPVCYPRTCSISYFPHQHVRSPIKRCANTTTLQ